jgi:hypothetical protein
MMENLLDLICAPNIDGADGIGTDNMTAIYI